MEHPGFPGILNGTRQVTMTLAKDIPSSVSVAGFDCRVWHQGQPQLCPICRGSYKVKNCPFHAVCRRCHQPGHMALECHGVQAFTAAATHGDAASTSPGDAVPFAPGDAASASPSDVLSIPGDATSASPDVPSLESSSSPEMDADPDYVPDDVDHVEVSSASDGLCSGDEEVIKNPPSPFRTGSRKCPASSPPSPASRVAFEDTVDLRDNQLDEVLTPVHPSIPSLASSVSDSQPTAEFSQSILPPPAALFPVQSAPAAEAVQSAPAAEAVQSAPPDSHSSRRPASVLFPFPRVLSLYLVSTQS